MLDISRKGSSSLDPWGPWAERFDILQPVVEVVCLLMFVVVVVMDGGGGDAEAGATGNSEI